MGLAALFVVVVIALATVAAIAYGTMVGLARAGRFLWRFLVEPEGPAVQAEAAGVPCWVQKECPPPVRESCSAYHDKEGLPCWLVNMRAEGRLRASCLTCSRFDVGALIKA